MDDLYQRDTLAWAERQAGLLARLAAGERVNAEIDWAHVIDEVQDVGVSELRACQSLWEQAMLHVLKLHVWPQAEARRHWRREARAFLGDAARRYTPAMRQRIDLADLYRRASEQLDDLREDEAGRAVPAECPFSVDDLLAIDPDRLATRLPA